MSKNHKRSAILFGITALLFALTAVLCFVNRDPGDNFYGYLTIALTIVYACLAVAKTKKKEK